MSKTIWTTLHARFSYSQPVFFFVLLRSKKKKRLSKNDRISEAALDLGPQSSLADDEELAMQLLTGFWSENTEEPVGMIPVSVRRYERKVFMTMRQCLFGFRQTELVQDVVSEK